MIVLLQQRNQQAFSYLYDNYSIALNTVIFRMVEDKELTEDILQEAFVKIWNNFSTYDKTKGRLFTWLLNITKNLTIDTLRSKTYRQQGKILGDENSVSNVQDKNSGIERFDTMGLKNQLQHLKPDQRKVIDMAYFTGYTQEEIAKELAIPLGTVKTRIRSGIVELRKIIEQK